jgi:hypothetical protein
MKRHKTTDKLTKAERRKITEQVNRWAQTRGKPSTKAELKARWQQFVFVKVKRDAERDPIQPAETAQGKETKWQSTPKHKSS